MNDIPEEELADITEEDLANKRRYEAEEETQVAEDIVGNLEENQPEAQAQEWKYERGDRVNAFYDFTSGKAQSYKEAMNKGRLNSRMSGVSADIQEFTNKLSKVESGGSYTALNKGSGAYGRYQFIPSTLKEYAKKTGQSVTQAKTPEGQDKMFAKFTEDNATRLKKRGIQPTELNLWIAHNQGVGGATAILKAKTLPAKIKKNIASNLPSGIEPTAENYINYWSKKFNS